MKSKNVKVSVSTHDMLMRIANERHTSINNVINMMYLSYSLDDREKCGETTLLEQMHMRFDSIEEQIASSLPHPRKEEDPFNQDKPW
jgi:hypothetical protein